jgi:RHS repeat-associated protein
MQIVSGADAGRYFYTRDHLGSIRELIDTSGSVRARYSYDPYGRRTKLTGDLDADFGFAGMFWSPEAALSLARFRAYDPQTGRWLSRDPLRKAEEREGPNLYAYVRNNPVNLNDPLGLAPDECCALPRQALDGRMGGDCIVAQKRALQICAFAQKETPGVAAAECVAQLNSAADWCTFAASQLLNAETEYLECVISAGCYTPTCPAPGGSPPGPVGGSGGPPSSPDPGGYFAPLPQRRCSYIGEGELFCE